MQCVCETLSSVLQRGDRAPRVSRDIVSMIMALVPSPFPPTPPSPRTRADRTSLRTEKRKREVFIARLN